MINNYRLDSLEVSAKRVQAQVGQLEEPMQKQELGNLSYQVDQVKDVIILQRGKVVGKNLN